MSTFTLTLANPLMLVLFAAVFAGVGIEYFSKDVDLIGFLILGIFSGSMLWWFALCSTLGLLHRHVAFTSLTWTNKASGLLIATFGIIVIFGSY